MLPREVRLPISVIVVTHEKNAVLAEVLSSFIKGGLREAVDQVEVYDSAGQAVTESVCTSLGFSYTSCAVLHSLATAQNEAVQAVQSDYVLLLEDDSYLLSSPQHTYQVLRDSVRVLQAQGDVETVRLRHRERPGFPLYPEWFAGNENVVDKRVSPHLLNCVHWYEDPPSRIPQLEELTLGGVVGRWFGASHVHACYTNNPCLYRRKWWLQNVVPENKGAGADNEENLKAPWMGLHPFRVAHGPGLFSHWDFEKHPESTLGQVAYLSKGKSIDDYR